MDSAIRAWDSKKENCKVSSSYVHGMTESETNRQDSLAVICDWDSRNAHPSRPA